MCRLNLCYWELYDNWKSIQHTIVNTYNKRHANMVFDAFQTCYGRNCKPVVQSEVEPRVRGRRPSHRV